MKCASHDDIESCVALPQNQQQLANTPKNTLEEQKGMWKLIYFTCIYVMAWGVRKLKKLGVIQGHNSSLFLSEKKRGGEDLKFASSNIEWVVVHDITSYKTSSSFSKVRNFANKRDNWSMNKKRFSFYFLGALYRNIFHRNVSGSHWRWEPLITTESSQKVVLQTIF